MHVTKELPSVTTESTGGLVIENIDPEQIGRILVQVPDVLGELPSSWAMPCVPVSGIQSGIFAVPPIGSQVWVEFEQGDRDYPIWTGGFWGLVADVPIFATAPRPSHPGRISSSKRPGRTW